MVKFSRRWNGDGWFSPTMEWRWFLKILTITIDGMVPAQPLAAMVFQWFFQFWGPMVHDGYAFFTKNEICDKMRVNEDLSETKHGMKSTSTQVDINQGTSCSRHCKKIFLIFQKLSLVCLISASARHKGRKFTTIAKNQWFLRWPLPLMEWYLLNHWDQWFFNGFQSANHW